VAAPTGLSALQGDPLSTLILGANKTIHYKVISGKSSNPHLIFLHEGLGCTALWKDFPEQLCHKTQCAGLVYDRLGYGLSSPMEATRTIHYLHDYALKELPLVIESIIPQESYILVGHSDGGSISLIFGAEKPSLLKAIITEAAHVFVESETVAGIRVAHESFARGKLNGLYKYHGPKTDRTFKAWSETWLSAWFRPWNIEYALPSIECAVLAIQGRDDQYGTENQVNSIVAKVTGGAESCFVPHCGHSPHSEQPERLVQIMSEFIERHK
jgi:pimeloyl-ACP methyl ester carboxylesterase